MDTPDGPCHRCRWSKRPCIPRQRAPRSRPQAEQLSEESIIADLTEINQEIDRTLERYTRLSVSQKPYWEIQEVLDKLANLPPTYVPTDFARAQLSTRGEEYWQQGPSSNLVLRGMINERGRVPDILLNNILEPREANELFERFMQYWNHGLGLLDSRIHSPRTLLQRCPLLFTVVLTVASRDYSVRPNLHQRLLQQAKLSATAALTDGLKSADTVQALLLMASYPPPAQRFTDDRTSLFVGMAVRMAMDLNLQLASRKTPTSDFEALELANHKRIWRTCLLLDSWNAVKHGRPPVLEPRSEPRDSDLRSLQGEFEYRIFKAVNQFMQLAKAGSAEFDCMSLTRDFDDRIQALRDEVHDTMRRTADRDQPSGMLRKAILNQTIEYARMVVYSCGFTRTLRQGSQRGGDYTIRCVDAATASVRGFLEHLAPLPYLKYSPDGWFEYAAFSAAFLLKLLQPRFQDKIDPSTRTRILDLIKRLIDMYRSSAVALQADNHLPRVLAQFLENAARQMPEYTAVASGSRGLSRSSRNTPSPPRIEGSAGFDASPEEALMAALSGVMPEWWQEACFAITSGRY